MRNTNALSTTGELRARTPTFSVVLAYHQYADGIRAKEFSDRLVFKHGELFHFICHLWRFDVLREPQLFEAPTRDALGADMIVLAIRQSQELSVEARRRIAHWLPSKRAGFDTFVLFWAVNRAKPATPRSCTGLWNKAAEGVNGSRGRWTRLLPCKSRSQVGKGLWS